MSVIIGDLTKETRSCVRCNRYSQGDDFILAKDTLHVLRHCCKQCYQEYAVECPRCKTVHLRLWGARFYIQVCERCEKPSADVVAEAERLYKIEQKERHKIRQHVSVARRLERPGTLTYEQWRATLHDFDYKCAYCLSASYEQIDHFVPLCKGGDTSQFNCVPACRQCNQAKGQKDPLECRNIAIPYENICRVSRYLFGGWQLKAQLDSDTLLSLMLEIAILPPYHNR